MARKNPEKLVNHLRRMGYTVQYMSSSMIVSLKDQDVSKDDIFECTTFDDRDGIVIKIIERKHQDDDSFDKVQICF